MPGTESGIYVTTCYMVFDAASGLAHFVNAGHPIPPHFQAVEISGKWIMDNESLRDPALAIGKNAQYRTIEKKIQPGEKGVMYTDDVGLRFFAFVPPDFHCL